MNRLEENDSVQDRSPGIPAPAKREVSKENVKNAPRVRKENSENNTYVELDFERLSNLGILTPHVVNMTLSEQLRRIKLPILENAFGENGVDIKNRNMVMITSALQNEGKSFTSFNLAMSIAKEFNHTVLYVDSDITKRSMENLFGVERRAGLVDYLLDGNHDLSDLLLKTNVERLTLLPAGRPYDQVTELWSSKEMTELMTELALRYQDRIIIFDAPPLLQESSSSIIAKIVGQVILIVEAEKTPRHIVEEAVNSLDGSQYIALILNKSNQRESTDYGYYYSAD